MSRLIHHSWQQMGDCDRGRSLNGTATMTCFRRVGGPVLLFESPATLTAFTGRGFALDETEVPGIGFVYGGDDRGVPGTNAEEAVAGRLVRQRTAIRADQKSEETLRFAANSNTLECVRKFNRALPCQPERRAVPRKSRSSRSSGMGKISEPGARVRVSGIRKQKRKTCSRKRLNSGRTCCWGPVQTIFVY